MQEKLLDWYHNNHRQLPWREDHNPYKIWLSEIMLQQTQVATVINYFNKFISRYPTIYDLAKAEEDDVLKLWEGLGYYSRARRLIPCARMIINDYHGQFPSLYSEMIKLPGIGSYTAGAILSIAYNIKQPAVDGNVMRVFSRLYEMEDDLSKSKTKSVFELKVKETLPHDVRHYNQALMELGATICTPKPKCAICPIREFCAAYKNDRVLKFPVKSRKIKKKIQEIIVCIIEHDGLLLIEKRPSEGLLASMWGFPCFESNCEISLEDYDLEVLDQEKLFMEKHVFTHIIWEMTVIRVNVRKRKRTDFPKTKWILKDDLKDYPLPTAFKKLLKRL